MLMFKLWMMVQKVLQKEEGQSMVEYGLIIALIAVVVIAALVVLGPTIRNLFTSVNTTLANTAP
ncbi:Flp family type IVb pilin [Alicyclobacillus mengziensis]|nr:Flp family type IVb pilin [Alicyclobacillus mengziensis]